LRTLALFAVKKLNRQGRKEARRKINRRLTQTDGDSYAGDTACGAFDLRFAQKK